MSYTVKDLLVDFGSMTVAQLVSRSSLPETLVRNDLFKLQEAGVVGKVVTGHGGEVFFIKEDKAIEVEEPVEHEFLYEEYEKGRLAGRQEVFKGMWDLAVSFPDFPFPKGAPNE